MGAKPRGWRRRCATAARRAQRRARRASPSGSISKGGLLARTRKRAPATATSSHWFALAQRTAPPLPVRKVHKVRTARGGPSARPQAGRAARAAARMCAAPRAARLAAPGQSSSARPGPAPRAPTAGTLRKDAGRSLAEIVAQIGAQRGGGLGAKTIAPREQQQQQLTRAGRPALLDIENCQSPATRSLLESTNNNNNSAYYQWCGKLQPHTRKKLKTTIVDFRAANLSPTRNNFPEDRAAVRNRAARGAARSLDSSVRFLHERRQRLVANQEEPQRQAQRRPEIMTRPGGVTVPAAGGRRPSGSQSRLGVSRLVAVRNSGTQTTRVVAGELASVGRPLGHGQNGGGRASPYNTRQRAGPRPPVPQQQAAAQQAQVPQQQQQPQQPNSLAICKRLGSLTLHANEMEQIKTSTKAHEWFWSEWDKSHECVVADDKLALCFHPHSSESAAACRAAEPLRRNGNHYYWEVQVADKCYGTSVMFGLCTRAQRLHVNDYCNLVGLDDQGWSLSHKGLIWHNGQKVQYTGEFPRDQPLTVGLLYNTQRGELSYFLDGKSLGVAFTGLNDLQEELYPVVGSTAKCTRMRLVGSRCSHVSLLGRSCFTLLKWFARDRRGLIEHLRARGLPKHLLEYVAEMANVDSDDEEDDYEDCQAVRHPLPARTRSDHNQEQQHQRQLRPHCSHENNSAKNS